MSLLEGHASYVMNEVAREHVADVDRMRRALAVRRRGSSMERGVQKAIGFEQKIQQYDGGETVRARGDRERGHGRLQPRVGRARATCRRSTRSASPRAGSSASRARPMARAPAGRRARARARHRDRRASTTCSSRATRARLRSRAVPTRCVCSSRCVRLRRLLRIRLEVFHFDHRLRRGSAADADVRAPARRPAPVCRSTCGVADDAPARGELGRGVGARTRRIAARRGARARSAPSAWPTAHTLDDQAETVLLRLLARIGLDGHGRASATDARPATCGRCWTSPAPRSRHSAGRSPASAARPDERGPPRCCATRSGCEAIPALERATGRERARTVRAHGGAAAPPTTPSSLRQSASCVDDAIVEETRRRRRLPGRRALGAARRPSPPAVVRRPGDLPRCAELAVDRGRRRGRRSTSRPAGPGRRRDLSAGLKARRDRAYVRVASPDRTRSRREGSRPVTVTHRHARRYTPVPVRPTSPTSRRSWSPTEEIEAQARARWASRSPGLRRPVAAAGRGAQGRVRGHGRPRPSHPAAARVRLHGGLVLRRRHEDQRRGAHPEGPRPRSRGPRRAAGRGHRGLGPDAEVPAEEPRGAQARLARGGGPAAQDRASRRCRSTCGTSGFEIPPEFVVGYGLDYAERFRNLPYVATLKPEAYGGV